MKKLFCFFLRPTCIRDLGFAAAMLSAVCATAEIPTIDISADLARQVVVDQEEGQYLGHVTTVLLEDRKTILAVYPKGHGCGAIVMKRSRGKNREFQSAINHPVSFRR